MEKAKPNSPIKVERGPVRNVPPTLEWIAVERLQVDPAYQREVDGPHSRKIVSGMIKGWDWALCQPLVVSRRVDGGLFILDGQHRHRGACERGDIPHLPCVILSDVDHEGEAAAFVALNTKRQRLNQGDIFLALLAAGDDEAVIIADLLATTGWRQTKTRNTDRWEAGDLNCAPMLVKAMKTHGEAVIRNALAALGEAYSGRPVSCSATLLRALMNIYRDGDLDGEDPDTFIAALGEIDPRDWGETVRQVQQRHPMLSRNEALVHAMIRNYREALKAEAA